MIPRLLRSRIGIALVAAVVLIGGATALKFRDSASSAQKSGALAVAEIIQNSLSAQNDVEAIASTSAQVVAPTASPSQSEPDPKTTATDRLAREMMSEYLAAKGSGEQIDANVSGQIAENVLAQDYSKQPTLYSATDIKTAKDSSFAATVAYGNRLGAILSAPPAANENDLQIFERLASEPAANHQKELEAIQKRYQIMKSSILALPAPAGFAAIQAEFASAVGIFSDAVAGALAYDADPVGALTAISRYDSGIEIAKKALSDAAAAFQKKGVTFKSSDAGYIFAQ